jgi:dephospho-CoA kinase
VWLDNSGGPDDLVAQVDRLWSDRVTPFEASLREHRCAERSGMEAVAPSDPTAVVGSPAEGRVSAGTPTVEP